MINPFKWSDYEESNCEKESEALLVGEQTGQPGIQLQILEMSTPDVDPGNISHANIWIWCVALVLMGLFFLLAAIVQHNDPDPYIWMTAYITPCLVSWYFAFTTIVSLNKLRKESSSSSYYPNRRANVKTSRTLLDVVDMLISGHIIYCFVLGIWTLTSFALMLHYGSLEEKQMQIDWRKQTKENNMNAEEGKELLGLCLIITWLSLLRNFNFIHLGRTGVYLAIGLTLTPFMAWIFVEVYEQGTNYDIC